MALICDTNTHIHLNKLQDKYFTNKKIMYIVSAIKKISENKKDMTFIDLQKYLKSKIKDENKYIQLDEIIMYCLGEYWSVYSDSIETNIETLISNYNKTELRLLLKNLEDMANDTGDIDINDVKTQLVDKLNDLETINNKEQYINSSELLIKALDTLEINRHRKKEDIMLTGITMLDAMTDGLHGSEMTCIGARPRNR